MRERQGLRAQLAALRTAKHQGRHAYRFQGSTSRADHKLVQAGWMKRTWHEWGSPNGYNETYVSMLVIALRACATNSELEEAYPNPLGGEIASVVIANARDLISRTGQTAESLIEDLEHDVEKWRSAVDIGDFAAICGTRPKPLISGPARDTSSLPRRTDLVMNKPKLTAEPTSTNGKKASKRAEKLVDRMVAALFRLDERGVQISQPEKDLLPLVRQEARLGEKRGARRTLYRALDIYRHEREGAASPNPA